MSSMAKAAKKTAKTTAKKPKPRLRVVYRGKLVLDGTYYPAATVYHDGTVKIGAGKVGRRLSAQYVAAMRAMRR